MRSRSPSDVEGRRRLRRRLLRRPEAWPDRGSVTAETAVLLPALVLVLAVALGVLRAASVRAAAQDAAGVGARVAARGEPDEVVRRAVFEVAPAGSRVLVSRTRGLVLVTVDVRVTAEGGAARLLPALEVSGHAVAADESGVWPG